jgi:predicted ferric reductase
MPSTAPTRPAGAPTPRRARPRRQPSPAPGPDVPAAAAGRLGVRLALAGGGAVMVGMWWHDTSAGAVSGLAAQVTAAGRVAGLLGAYLVLVQLLLMARLPWFERAVGFDRLAGWHRGLGTNVVLLLVAHVLLVVEGYALTARRSPAGELWTVLRTYPDMLKASAGLLLFGLVAVTSARLARARLSYESWYWLHTGAYLAVALAFFHQVSTGADFVGRPANRVFWFGLYGAVAGSLLVWRIGVPVRRWLRHRMVVERVVAEADGVVSVWIRGHALAELAAEPGQFLLWRFVTPGHLWTAHPYSLSAPPTPHRLRITVKAAGDHSHALRWLRPGVPVLAEGPFGHFTPAAGGLRRVLLIAGGAGIGPIRALAEAFANRPRSRAGEVVVVYRASRPADLALAGELEQFAARRRLTVRFLVGRRQDLGYDPLAPELLTQLVPDLHRREVYVCGPAGMTEAVVAGLRRAGVHRSQLHTEEFTLR